VTAELDARFAGSLQASVDGLSARIGGLCDRMDRETQHRQRANQAFRQVSIGKGMAITGGAGSVHLEPHGPPAGYYWSIRRLTAYNYSAGTVTAFLDSVSGEPLVAFPAAAVYTFGKGEILIHPNSTILVTGASITPVTGTYVYLWGSADQFESWLLPWYIGAQRDGSLCGLLPVRRGQHRAVRSRGRRADRHLSRSGPGCRLRAVPVRAEHLRARGADPGDGQQRDAGRVGFRGHLHRRFHRAGLR
jgi:hypothetical protein